MVLCPFNHDPCVGDRCEMWLGNECAVVSVMYGLHELIGEWVESNDAGQPSVAAPIPVVVVPRHHRLGTCSVCGKKFDYDESGGWIMGTGTRTWWCSSECQERYDEQRRSDKLAKQVDEP